VKSYIRSINAATNHLNEIVLVVSETAVSFDSEDRMIFANKKQWFFEMSENDSVVIGCW